MMPAVLASGAITSIGLTAPSTIAAQRAGIAGNTEHAYMIDRTGEPMIVARVPWGGADEDPVARMGELAAAAAQEALTDLDGRPIDMLLALPDPRPGLPTGYPDSVADRLTAALSNMAVISTVNVKPLGNAAGLSLLKQAATHVARVPEALVLVGGVDTWLTPETLEWLDSIESLHSAAMPWGFCPAEAAAFCVIGAERAESRLAIVGAGEAVEENRIRTETVCIGRGLSTAWRSALAPLERTPHRVDAIWADLNSEPYRGEEIGFSVLRTREHLADEVEILTAVDCWGDVGAASGPLMLIAAEAGAKKGYAKGPLSLLSASSDSGMRAALLVYDRETAG
jgi:3-oxoacyl-[acyl-carrier-protein] synthase I